MLKNYVKYLLIIICLPYVYSAQASEGTVVLYKGEPARYGMNPLRWDNLQQQPSLFKTYPLPILTSGLVSLAGAGFALQDTHQWAPYVGWGTGALAISLLSKKLWNLSATDNAKSIYAPLAVGSVGGFLIGGLLGKLLQNRELNPYMLVAIAGTGALCGIGAQYAMPHAMQPEQEPSGKNVQNGNLIHQRVVNFVAVMLADGWKEPAIIAEQDDDPEKVKEWRAKALEGLKKHLSESQEMLLKRTYHRQQIKNILLESEKANSYLSEFKPNSLQEWLMWASKYYKTVPEEQLLAMIKEDLSKHEDWFKRGNNDFTDVFNFIMQLQDAQYLNKILGEVHEYGYKSLRFFQKIRDLKEAELQKEAN